MDECRSPAPAVPDPADEELLQSIADGEASALRLLFDRYERPLAEYLYRVLEDREEVEEALVDVFTRAWRGAAGFEGGAPVQRWLYRIATNLAIDRLRRRRRTPQTPVSLDELNERDARFARAGVSDPAELFLTAYQRDCDRRALLLALRQVKPQDRTLLTLHYFLDCSYEQIGEITGESLVRVKGRLYRARQRLKRHFLALRDSDEVLETLDEPLPDPTWDADQLLVF